MEKRFLLFELQYTYFWSPIGHSHPIHLSWIASLHLITSCLVWLLRPHQSCCRRRKCNWCSLFYTSFFFSYRFSLGGVVSWLEKDLDHTVRKRKERRAKKERKAKRRSKISDCDLFLFTIITCTLWFIVPSKIWERSQGNDIDDFWEFFLSMLKCWTKDTSMVEHYFFSFCISNFDALKSIYICLYMFMIFWLKL